MSKRIVVMGPPIAKARPRFVSRGTFHKAYNPQETEEGRWLFEAKQFLDGHDLITGPVRLSIIFVMPRPKSHYGTGKNANKLKESAPIHHIKKPDLDNLEKFVKDCLNGEAWKDDCQVVMVDKLKRYGNKPRTEVIITPL